MASWLGECVYTGRERASFYVGLLSIGCWVLCQMPQLVHNIRRGSADGLSIGLLAQWICGDSMNFVGSVLTDQLGFQKAAALLFVSMDMAMISQRAYYYRSDKTAAARSSASNAAAAAARAPLLAAATIALLAPTVAEASPPLTVLQMIPSCEIGHVSSHAAHVVGQLLGWGATLCYIGSRIPQILQNRRRQSVDGVSSIMYAGRGHVRACCGAGGTGGENELTRACVCV